MPPVKSPYCSSCRENLRASNCRYCLICKALYMKEWRKTHPPSKLERLKNNALAYLRMYIKRGKAQKLQCRVCGAPATPTHKDYAKPLEVTWLCKLHKKEFSP